jgi:hypothetical protein
MMEEGTYSAYAGLPPSHDPPVSDDGWTGSLLPNILPYSYYPPVNAQARNHFLCNAALMSTNADIQAHTIGLFSSLRSGPIQGMDEAWMPDYGHPLLQVQSSIILV